MSTNAYVSQFIFCPEDLSIGESGIWKPPTINGLMSLNAVAHFFKMKFGVPECGVYDFRTVMSSWVTVPLIRISFSMTSILSAIKMMIPTFFLVPLDWNTFSQALTLGWYPSLKLRCVSWRQQVDAFLFLIQSVCVF